MFTDGYHGVPRRVWSTAKRYPFKHLGDTTTAMYTSTYRVDPAAWSPAELASEDTASDRPYGAGFYLINESEPLLPRESGVAEFTRTYSMLPTTQVREGSVMLNRPALSGDFPQTVGSYRVFQPDSTLQQYDAYERRAVQSDSGAPTGFYATSGSYVPALLGTSAASTAYNASAATLQSNLNAITPISDRGGVTVTGSYNTPGGFGITFASYAAATIDVSSLTHSTGSTTSGWASTSNGGYSQSVQIGQGSPDGSSSAPSVNISSLTYTGIATQESSAFTGQFTFRVSFTGAITGGTFRLVAYGETSSAIALGTSAAGIKAIIEASMPALAARGTVLVQSNAPLAGAQFLFIDVSVSPRLTGGTYAVTMFGQTTAGIPYNSDPSAIQSALNALTEVIKRGGATVTGTGFDSATGRILFSIGFSNPLIAVDVSGLAPVATALVASADSGINRLQTVRIQVESTTRTFFVPTGHNLLLGDTLMIRNNSADYTGISGVFTLPDENTVVLTVRPSDSYVAASTITELGRCSRSGYSPGAAVAAASEETRFSFSELTPDVYQGDAAALLQGLLSGADTINVRVGDSVRWPTDDSPIRAMTTTKVSAAYI